MPPPTTNASSSATGQPTPATPAKGAAVTAPATSTKVASASPANAAGATGSGAAGASAPANKRSASVSSTSTAAATPESTSGKKDSKRRKVNLACVYCRRSHMTCDDSRPCKRCVKRDIGHLCHDRPPGSQKGPEAASAKSEAGSASPDKALEPKVPKPALRKTPSSLAGPGASAPTQLQPKPGIPLAPSASPQELMQSVEIDPSSSPAAAIAAVAAPSSAAPAQPPSELAAAGGADGGMWPNNLSLSSLGYTPAAASAAPPMGPMMPAVLPSSGNVWNSFRSGLGGASWLGLGGGPMSMDGEGGAVTQGDSAGGSEFNILSEFLESLDGNLSLMTPGPGAGAYVGMNGGASQAATPAAMAADPSKQDGDAFVNYDGAPAGTGADAAADVLSSYSTLNDAEKGGGNAKTPRLSRPNTPRASHRRQLSMTASNAAAAETRAAVAGRAGSVSGPSLNWSSKTERFFLTAADQNDGTRDERLGKVIQAKYEAGLLRPYNHVNGYARLNRWMEQNVSPASRRRILKPLSVFRPAFRAVAQSLTNIDLIYIEEAFERLLLDYDRVFSTQGIPACLWRRTGEIYKGNKEFAELVGVEIDALREGRLCIYELMAEESAVNYWEKYGAVSFDPGQKAVLTSCVLKTRSAPRSHKSIPAALAVAAQLPRSTQASSTNGEATPQMAASKSNPGGATNGAGGAPAAPSSEPGDAGAGQGASTSKGADTTSRRDGAAEIKCCFSFTIRRDQWNIPTMIVGNFLPMNPAA